jgi:hypothetical protein
MIFINYCGGNRWRQGPLSAPELMDENRLFSRVSDAEDTTGNHDPNTT